MTKIKTFENHHRHVLEREVNEFISDKEVVNISFSATTCDSGTYYYYFYYCCVCYEEKEN